MELKRTLLYEQVVEQIYNLIDKAKYKPGDRLPTEHELMEKWKVSRNVLREAFHILEHRGLIVTRQGSGRFIREINPITLSTNNKEDASMNSISIELEKCSVYDIYITRQQIEPKIVEEVARYSTSNQIENIRKAYAQHSKLFMKSGNTAQEFDMHRLYTNNCNNYILVQMAEFSFMVTEDLMLNRLHDVYNRHTVEESLKSHNLIISAIERKDTEAAKRAMFNHLQNTIDLL